MVNGQWSMVNGQWFIVSYDSANKQKHHKSHRMQVLRNNSWTSNKHNEKKNKKTSERRTW